MNRSHLAACLGAPQVRPIITAPVFSPPALGGRCRAAGVLVLAAGLIMAGIMAAAAPAEALRGEVPLVVAVDTSRSLTPSDLATIRATITEQLEVLPAGTPVGLVAFNDSAQWLARPGSSSDEVVQALPRLEPAGSYTVLHDALYIAARELGSNGVILLITDGRDERSATTIEDVARLCSGSNVRLVATSLGRSIDERAMRRLALLTDGEYLGRLGEADPGRIAAAISRVGIRVRQSAQPEPPAQARSSPAGSAQPGGASPQDTAATGQQDTSGTQPAAEPGGLERLGIGWLPLLGAALLVIALIAVVVWLMLRRDRDSRSGYDLDSVTPGDRLDQSSDRELDADGLADSLTPELDEVRTAAHTQPVADLAIPDETVLDPAVFDKAPVPPGLDRTMVLDEMPVLIVRQAGRPPRSYTLPRDQVFAVGRAPKVNTLELQEPTVSAQHFKLVPKNDELYVVDLDTTNGTSVNHKKVRVKKLAPGDIITAGTVEFEYKLSVKRLS